ncbi:hypothetical protein [Spartinivicinus ruber]|uniref:hypothetical protein n=1 Tax=Spartinivicinus ruber TaxID=2683272 RepID=UPI0013D34258|nr:hypothetical protein [Spartinivicinus ruber]
MKKTFFRLLFWSIFGGIIGFFIAGKEAYGDTGVYITGIVAGAIVGTIFGLLFNNLNKK